MIRFFKALYFDKRFFYALFAIAFLFLISFWLDWLYQVTWIILAFFGILSIADLLLLFRKGSLEAQRILPEKFSNSDPNPVNVKIKNNYSFPVRTEIIDEIPIQFQKRDFLKELKVEAKNENSFEYSLTPVKRGEYFFGNLNVYTSTFLGLVKKRYTFNRDQMVKVYPSFIQMKKLDFLAMDNKITLQGFKKIRRLGHTMEFEQIKEYVHGDDVRNINWNATAKQNRIMVNQFQDERAQPVYSVIDCGRIMKMPFEGLSLLDYSVNSSLAFSNIALKKKDKVGLLAFSNKMHTLLKASSRLRQLSDIMENLYGINTGFLDSDYSMLYSRIKKHISHRSMIMLYTNFEHISGLKRNLPYLSAISKKHLLVTVIFENTEITKLVGENAETVAENAHQTIAEKFHHDKLVMVRELERYGIQTILTKPKDLSVATINKYLEIKARGLL